MTNTPLDAPTEFMPAESERPAGQWMEGYWAKTAPWARYFAFATWAYVGWISYQHLKSFSQGIAVYRSGLIHIGVLLLYTPIVLLGYYCFRFAQDLERALAGQDQLLLEKAFRQLHRFLGLGLVVAVFWMWSSISQWYAVINIMSGNEPIQYELPF